MGEQLSLSDLNDIDSNTVTLIKNLEEQSKFLTDEEFEAGFDQNFVNILSNQDEVELKPDGTTTIVTRSSIDEFKELVIKARSGECLR